MYFKEFPKRLYPYTINDELKQTAVTDIFRRVIINKFFNNAALMKKFYVTDGDTPEIVADKIYGNVLYHWVVLLSNNIVDVNKEWPLSQEDLVLYCNDKYGANNRTSTHHYVLAADTSIIVDWDATKVANGTYKEVTNYDYEEELNEQKRQIVLLDPKFLNSMVRQFRKEIRR